MTKGLKFSLGWTAFLLILEATICRTHSQFFFVDARIERALRGASSNKIRLDSLPHRELPEASTRKLKEKDDKNNKKDKRYGVATIEASPPENSDTADSGRDEIESPNVSSQSLESPESITTDASSISTLPPLPPDNVFEPATIGENETEQPGSPPDIDDTENPNPIIYLPNNTGPEVAADQTEFVTVAQMEPITFDITLAKLTTFVVDNDELKTYFKNLVEDVLDMKSNGNWYPSHSKSMRNVSIALLPSAVSEPEDAEDSADDKVHVQLYINGYVAVHTKDDDVKVATTRNRKEGEKHKKNADYIVSIFKFHESFDHSMLLYFTFWGVESIEEILKQEGGLKDPVINSVSIGEKELMAFGTDKDDNYLYKGDHDSTKPHRLPEGKISGLNDASSTRASTYGLLTLILISAVGLII